MPRNFIITSGVELSVVQRRADLDLLTQFDEQVARDRDRLLLDLAVVADDRDLASRPITATRTVPEGPRDLRGALGRTGSRRTPRRAPQAVRYVRSR